MPDGAAPGPVRVVVVDDHQMFATSLAQVLQAEPDLLVVGLATSIREARELVASATPDVVLLVAMEAGAAGFIAKTQRLDDVLAGVRAAAEGESMVSAKLLGRLLPRL